VSNGSTIDLDKVMLAPMDDLAPNLVSNQGLHKYTLRKAFALLEEFQNYWYIDGIEIKFTQPDQFSSFGTNVSTPLNLYDYLNQRSMNENALIDKEQTVFRNENETEFVGQKIDYLRSTPVLQERTIDYTTDVEAVEKIFEGRLLRELNRSGFLLIYVDGDAVPSDVGQISGSDTKNNKLSKSNIQYEYLRDYRYKYKGQIKINGTNYNVQNTVRSLLLFPDFENEYNSFQTNMGNVDWGGGVYSYITRIELNLNTYITKISSRLLDL
jgi:hypothetical protein